MYNFSRLGEFVISNPKVTILKGTIAPYIPMEEISSNCKHAIPKQKRAYNGGSRFENKDTIFARITPCLQNRKIAQYLSNCSPAYGSTEYFVFRAIKDVSDPDFIYYLMKSDEVVNTAINSMKGASGRQRAEIQPILDLKLNIPDLPTQQKIAAVLSAYDNLIENNNRRITILEEMAQKLYREWFVHFRFPGHENVKMVESEMGLIPEGWELKNVKDVVIRCKNGTVYTDKDVATTGSIPVIDQSTNEVLGYHNNCADFQASVEMPIAIFGDHTCKMQLNVRPFSIGPNVITFSEVKNHKLAFVYYAVLNLIETKEYKRHWNDFMKKVIVIPTQKEEICFADTIAPFLEQVEQLKRKNTNLRKTRDLLLPRLISGDIDVSDLDIPIKEG